MDEFLDQCGSCVEFENYGEYTKGWCQYYRQFFWPTESCKNHYKNRETYSSGCYITTVVCSVLGMSDKSGVLETLREFRDNVMQKDEAYKETLYEYDIVGPVIASKINEDYKKNNNIELVNNIFNFYIAPTASLIKEQKYDEAVERYKEMTEDLREYYQIPKPEKIEENYDMTSGGHGKVKTLKK